MPLPPDAVQRGQACSAGDPYRDPYHDPDGRTAADQILAARRQAQTAALAGGRRSVSNAWRRLGVKPKEPSCPVPNRFGGQAAEGGRRPESAEIW